jgi:hypothetical protein
MVKLRIQWYGYAKQDSSGSIKTEDVKYTATGETKDKVESSSDGRLKKKKDNRKTADTDITDIRGLNGRKEKNSL